MVSTKCCRINIWHLICAAQWTYFLPLTNIVTTTCHAQASLDDSTQEISEVIPLEKDELMPQSCAPFVNYTKIDEESGYFYSPGYPQNYPSDIDCFFVLTAPSGKVIKLDFRDYFEVEESEDCQHDFLEVRDGPYGYSELINKKPICKYQKFPDEMISSDRHLWIHFKSDSTIEYQGFKAVYQFIDRASNVPEIIPCVINRINIEEGELGKVDINRSIAEYNKTHKPIDCLWTITVRKNWRIYLQFAQFNLEKPNECTSNFVQVFPDRPVEYIHKHIEFCGSLADTMLSVANKMYVRFYTTTLTSKTKFHANFTAFRGVADKPCDEEVEFFCEDDTCIAKDLKCNKKYNCRTRFDEEDDECHNVVPVSWKEEHIIIIMVIFSMILTGMCIIFIYNCITKLMRDHRTIQEFRRSQDQLHEIDKHSGEQQAEKLAHSLSKAASRSRSHSSPSNGSSRRFADATAIAVNCYVPGGEVLPMPLREQRSTSPINGDAYATDIYTVDDECPPQMCDSACQTRESLFTTQEYSSGNSSPSHHSAHMTTTTDSPPAPFSTFGYKKDNNRFRAEAKIEVANQQHPHQQEKRRPYSVQTTKSAPDVIVTH